MAGYTAGRTLRANRRPYRTRQRDTRGTARRAGNEDIIISAITMQVILCLILTGAFWLCRRGDAVRYHALKNTYTAMTSAGTDTADMSFSRLLQQAAELLNRPGRYLLGLLEKSEATEPQVDVPAATQTQEGTGADIPQEGRFSYNYLEQEKSGTGTATMIQLGAGGQNPTDGMVVPANVLLTPVALGAYLKPPVTGLVTSPFGYRAHPVTLTQDFHTGIDIAAEEGRAILAALPGEVVEVGESAIYGNYIILQHATNLRTFYAHCSEILAQQGAKIRQGERIAKVGQTGVATGPHLHFSVIVEGKFTDPYWVLKDNLELLV